MPLACARAIACTTFPFLTLQSAVKVAVIATLMATTALRFQRVRGRAGPSPSSPRDRSTASFTVSASSLMRASYPSKFQVAAQREDPHRPARGVEAGVDDELHVLGEEGAPPDVTVVVVLDDRLAR